MSNRQRVVILGSSFAGLTVALELKKRVRDRHDIVVVDPRPDFTFIPSLIWLPFGLRDPEDITFPLAPLYARKRIEFINRAAARVDPAEKVVTLDSGEELSYDRLFIGTGPRLAFEKVTGLGPLEGHTQSVCNLEHALLAREAWQRFLQNPGPVVVGTAQGGSCFGASYEFLFNIHHQIGRAGLRDVAPVTFITAEPFLGHFGLGGVGSSQQTVESLFDRLGIEGLPNSSIKQVRDGELELESGRRLPFAYAMIVPPFTGVDAVREAEGLSNPMGFVPVDEQFRHPEHPDVFAAGVAVAIAPPEPTPVPAGVPKTGQMTETMAKVAAHNIADDLEHSGVDRLPLEDLGAICILDAGRGGVIFKASNVLARPAAEAAGSDGAAQKVSHARLSAGPHAHWAKLAFERVFLSTRRRGALVL